MDTFVDRIFARAQEKTTYCGLISLLGSIGVAISPELQAAITALGLALAGVVLIARKERAKAVEAAKE